MSKVTLAREQNKKKREEEEKKVVGQQQKTQSDSHKPTGSTSIPKDNQGINSRAQKSTAISNRTQQNTQKQTVQKRSSYNASSDRTSSRAGLIEDYKKLPTANEVRHYQLPIQDRVKSDMDPMNFTPKKRTTTPIYRNGVKWGEKYTSQEQKPETTTISGKEFVGSKRTGLSNTERENLERQIASVDGYRNNYNSLTQDQKDLEKQILNADRYTEDTSKSHHEERLTLGEVEKGINSVTPEILKQWVSPDTKLDEGAKQIAKGYASRELQKYNYRAGHIPVLESDEDRQNYADLVNLLNKTSGIASFSQSALTPFANIARPIANLIGDEKVKKNIDENVRLAEENARVQNPGLSTAGNLAGNAGLYALTNPLFDEAAAALGVTSRAGKFIANQVGQNAQDLVLDTAPTAYNLASDGNLSEEDKRELLSNVFLNAAGNLAMGGLSEAFAKPKTSIPTPEQLPKVDDITKQLPDATNLYNNIDDLLVQENLNKALGANNPLSTLKDEQILNLTKRGGDQGVLADAYNNLVRSADMENIDNFTRALDDYRQIASDNNIPGLNRPLTRIDDAINGRLMPEVTPENYGYIANNIDAIEDGLNRIPEGLSDLGLQHMENAHNLLNQYEDAVRNGGDVYGLSTELNKTLANLDNQAKKLAGYDGTFSAWKGANTARGDLYTNTGRISKPVNTEITPEERALINEWIDYDNQNRYARPANQLTENSFENVNTPRYDENVNSVGSIGGNGNGTDINRARNSENFGMGEQNPLLSENGREVSKQGVFGSENSKSTHRAVVNDDVRNRMTDAGVTDVKLRDYSNDYKAYSDALSEARKANEHGAFVDPQSVEELQEAHAKAFMSDNGGCGVAIKDNGNIVGVFKNKTKYADPAEAAGAARDELLTARLNGGDRLDCYGADLVGMYSPAGFEPTHKVEYEKGINPEMDAWCKEELRKWIAAGKKEKDFKYPDIVFMKVRDGESVDDTLRLLKEDKIPEYDELLESMEYTKPKDGLSAYEVAEMERNMLIEKQPEKGAFFNGNIPDASSLPKAQKLDMNLQQFTDQPTRIPQPEDPRFGNSRVVTNTALNSDVVSMDQIVTSPIIQDIMKYEKHSNAETLNNAINRVTTEGNVWKDDYISGKKVISDDTDVDTAMVLLQDLNKKISATNDIKEIDKYTNEKNALLRKLREFGTRISQSLQSFAKWNTTADGALLTAEKVSNDDVVKPWKSKNQQAVKGNSRIAKALVDQGHKPIYKEAPVLTHEQIKQGVKAELEREMGSIEGMFNDNDLEFLTNLAENKQVPVWQITDEIEHKLNHGSWYTIDESTTPKMPTNRKLQNALNSLIEGEVRNTEPVKPDLRQITEEVRNTLKKESAELEGMFDDSDIDYLANLVNNNASREEIAEALNTKMATGRFGISAETQQKVNDLFKQAEMYDPNSKQFVECQAEAFRLLAEEIVPNATALEKFDAWRYMAMLGNPKTMLRNFVGNQMFGAVTGISNNIAAMGEAGVDKIVKAAGGEGIQRTKAVLNPVKDSDLIKASNLDADASRYRQMVGSKYEKMDKDALRQSRSVFNSKLGQLAEKAVDAGISDYHAIKNKYSTSLAGYLKANGYNASIFDAETQLKRLKNLEETQILSKSEKDSMERLTKEVSELEKARDFALKQAEYATFHEDNAFASWLTKISRDARQSDSKVLKGVGTVIEGVVPFKKTTANVLKSGLENSPLGAIDSIRQTGKLIYENTGKRAGNLAETYINKKGKKVTKTLAADVIDSWSKTLTGTGLTALGFYLFDKGILRDSDKETKYQDQLEGLQNYSIKINGKTYTIDWAAPAVMPLLLGAEISKVWNAQGNETSKWYEHLDEYMSAVNRIADPIIETSMLQGIQDALETAANAAQYNENLNVPTLLAYNALTGYVTQAIPTIGGQIARTIDPIRRSTYTDKEGVAGVIDKQVKKIMNKIPFLSMLNQPYIDTYGREQKNSPFDSGLANLGYQMFSPGYLADVNTTDADRISRAAFEQTGDEKTLPKWQSSAKIDGQRVSPEQYTDYSKAYGQANYDIRNRLANDEWFNSLSDDEKSEIIGDINSIAQKVGQSAIEEDYTNASKPYEAYNQGGIDGLIEYYKDQSLNNIAKQSGYSANTKAFEEIKEALVNGDTEAAQSKIDAAQELASAGLEKPSALTTYTRAQENISGLTVEEFTNTFKAMDSDNNQSIKQDELLEYADKNKVGQSEMEQLWKAYGNDWKSSPVLKDGKWATKSAKSATSTKTSSKASGTNTSGSTLADYRKIQKKSVASIPSAEDLPKATSGNWSVSNGSKSFDLHDSKGYQKAKSAGISDSDWLNAYWAANTDKNSKITKDEAMAYIDALQGLSKTDKRAWFDYLIGTRAKNPY